MRLSFGRGPRARTTAACHRGGAQNAVGAPSPPLAGASRQHVVLPPVKDGALELSDTVDVEAGKARQASRRRSAMEKGSTSRS